MSKQFSRKIFKGQNPQTTKCLGGNTHKQENTDSTKNPSNQTCKWQNIEGTKIHKQGTNPTSEKRCKRQNIWAIKKKTSNKTYKQQRTRATQYACDKTPLDKNSSD